MFKKCFRSKQAYRPKGESYQGKHVSSGRPNQGSCGDTLLPIRPTQKPYAT
jgi:hypothetical protein